MLHLAAVVAIAAGQWCSAPEVAADPLGHVRNVVSARGAEADFGRRIYNLPLLPADSVVRVTDEQVCERAARVYYRYELGPMPAGGVTVLRVGDRYVVEGAIRAGEWTIMSIYSSRFEHIVNIAA